MNWLDSNTVRSLAGAELLLVLQWLTVALATDRWDWRALALGTIAILVPLVKRLADPDVVAPVAVLNRGNATPAPGGTQ